MPRKLCYRQWLVNYGFDPREEGPAGEAVVFRSGRREPEEVDSTDDGPASADTVMVRLAVSRLQKDERELIERYYFMGQGYPEIAEALVCDVSRIERRHRLALRRLRRMLEPWVKNGDTSGLEVNCRICQSEDRESIERVIASKAAEESYRRVLRILRTQFGMKFNHPHLVIRHQNFHMQGRDV